MHSENQLWNSKTCSENGLCTQHQVIPGLLNKHQLQPPQLHPRGGSGVSLAAELSLQSPAVLAAPAMAGGARL